MGDLWSTLQLFLKGREESPKHDHLSQIRCFSFWERERIALSFEVRRGGVISFGQGTLSGSHVRPPQLRKSQPASHQDPFCLLCSGPAGRSEFHQPEFQSICTEQNLVLVLEMWHWK